MTRPLEGLRVVDAATILAGPFAASILGESVIRCVGWEPQAPMATPGGG